MTARPDTPIGTHMAAIVGARHVQTAPRIKVDDIRPVVVVRPGTAAEVAACLSAATEAGAAVAPWGGGTQQQIGMPPEQLDVVVDLGRMNAVVEWEPADLTACLEAGSTLAGAQARLRASGQQLAIDAPASERATVGGLVATNTCGPRRWLCGGWRDQIIGMQMALANGDVIKSGGRVVKNVQGYDLAKLFTGSLGTLGIICQINVKVAPVAAVSRLFVARGDLSTVASLLETVASSTLRVSTLDLLDQDSGRRAGIEGSGWLGLILVEGDRVVVEAQIDRLRALCNPMAVRPEVVEGDAVDAIWRAWVDLERVDDLAAAEALVALRLRPAEVVAGIQAILGAARDSGVAAACWARAGNGLIYARVQSPAEVAPISLTRFHGDLVSRWPGTTMTAGGEAVRRASWPWGAEPPGIGLMRGLKRRFDPYRTLQPGRYVGGI